MSLPALKAYGQSIYALPEGDSALREMGPDQVPVEQ